MLSYREYGGELVVKFPCGCEVCIWIDFNDPHVNVELSWYDLCKKHSVEAVLRNIVAYLCSRYQKGLLDLLKTVDKVELDEDLSNFWSMSAQAPLEDLA